MAEGTQEAKQVGRPPGTVVSGLESGGADRFSSGGARSGKLRAVRRSRKG